MVLDCPTFTLYYLNMGSNERRSTGFKRFQMTLTITPNTTFLRSTNLLSAETDGDIVMMDPLAGTYYGIGGVGPYVWELLEQPRTMQSLMDGVAEAFDVDEAVLKSDLSRFLEELMRHKLIDIC